MVGRDSPNLKMRSPKTKLYKGAVVCPDHKQRAVPFIQK